MSLKAGIITLLLVVILLGATGGDASAASVGRAIGGSFHWVAVAWHSMTGSATK